jgi:hypothetical protein
VLEGKEFTHVHGNAADLAKNAFEVAVTSRAGSIRGGKRLSWPQFERFWGNRGR